MKNEFNVESHFDIMYILNNLELEYERLAINEIQHIAYLSLLLSLFEGNGVSDWGYKFIYKDESPISSEILNTIKQMNSKNQIKISGISGEYIHQTEDFKKLDLFSKMCEISFFKKRQKYLKAAIDGTLRIPIPVVIKSIEKEPMIAQNIKVNSKISREFLGEGISSIELYSNFKNIKEVVGRESSNLWLASTLWLNYLKALVEKESDKFEC